MTKYFTFDRLNNDRILSLYSKKPMDFNTSIVGEEGKRLLYEQIEQDFGYSFRKVKKCTRQVHSDKVVVVTEENLEQETGEADGLITDLRGVALEIRTADCQSIFLYDPVRGVIGNVHSGWKGTLHGIVLNAIRKMTGHYGCRPADIEAYINPSILGCSFEVEDDVVDQFRAVTDVSRYCRKYRVLDGRQKYLMDTAALNRDAMIAEGLSASGIFLSGICTMCHHDEYHSYRGDGRSTGRNGSLICLK